MNTKFDIFISGVGGQGIGLLSETIIRAADYANLKINGTDTHGLAQRGGIVTSYVRIGEGNFSPLIPKYSADMVIGLELHEAFRGMNQYAKDGAIVVFYNVVWQPLPVRLRTDEPTSENALIEECNKRSIKLFKAYKENLEDARMQNVIILSTISKNKLIPGIDENHYISALKDLLSGKVLEENLKLFSEV